MDLLKFSLSLRTFSPAVQLFQQIGSEYDVGKKCSAFFDVNGITGCSAYDLEQAVINSRSINTPSLLSVDHIFGNNKDSPVVIIYGDLGSPDWLNLHKVATTLVRENKSKYIFRHFYNESFSTSEHVSLSGYGVELAIKNTEYKAEDDSTKKKEEVEENESNIHGFNFELLKNLHSGAKDSLELFKMHLKEIEELAPLKLWQVQDLSYQRYSLMKIIIISGSITGYNECIAIKRFVDAPKSISQSGAMKNSITGKNEKTKGTAEITCALRALNSCFWIRVDNEALTTAEILFKALWILYPQNNIMEIHDVLLIVYRYRCTYEDEICRFSCYILYLFILQFLNNLDSDKQYKQWGNSVKLMLQPYYPGMIRPIARNLFTLVSSYIEFSINGTLYIIFLDLRIINSDYDKGRQVGYIFVFLVFTVNILKIGAEFVERTAIGKAPKVLLNGFILDDAGSTTLWIVANLETKEGREIIYSAIKHLKHSRNSRNVRKLLIKITLISTKVDIKYRYRVIFSYKVVTFVIIF
uniref:Ion_trans domain-containing protein n=1 Tax=Heterorhabditis bacteriophora TaxID=37862 RepID=A0A1I7WAN1_HETBA